MSTPYEKGRAFEYRVRDHFRRMGFEVFRTAGSRSPVDLVCLRFRDVALVQCKKNPGISKKELEKFERLCRELYACGYVVSSDKNGHIYFKFVFDEVKDNEKV